jgi:hypothetical protein
MSTLVYELTRLAVRASQAQRDWRRLRIAVSPEESEEIRRFMLAERALFYARLMDIPLVVEETPLEPALRVELAE